MSFKKGFFLILTGSVFLLLAGLWRRRLGQPSRDFLSPLSGVLVKATPLDQYAFERLREREYKSSEIILEKVIKKEVGYTAWLFSYLSDGQRVTGMANIPTILRPSGFAWPVVIMLRGHVDDEVYFTGVGTRKAAGVFAENGFLTLAPDFLGFGDSDTSSADILEARFVRPVTVLNLLASIENFPRISSATPGVTIADPEKIAFWGHSNGGQIALSVLEITQRPIPTTLWAPVTRGFPECILTYMGELDDNGRKVKRAIDNFLKKYDPKKYSISTYFADINSSLQLHQGSRDKLVPQQWSNDFVAQMNTLGKQIVYYTYSDSDHNFKQNWDQVVGRDLRFFRSQLN